MTESRKRENPSGLGDENGKKKRSPLRYDVADEAFNNVCLVVGGQKFYVLKQHLANHSPYFKSLFFDNFQERDKEVITLEERICPEHFQNFLDYINLQKGLSDENLAGIVLMADVFLSETVQTACLQYLNEKCGLSAKEKFDIAVTVPFLNDYKKNLIRGVESLRDMLNMVPDIDHLDAQTLHMILERSVGFAAAFHVQISQERVNHKDVVTRLVDTFKTAQQNYEIQISDMKHLISLQSHNSTRNYFMSRIMETALQAMSGELGTNQYRFLNDIYELSCQIAHLIPHTSAQMIGQGTISIQDLGLTMPPGHPLNLLNPMGMMMGQNPAYGQGLAPRQGNGLAPPHAPVPVAVQGPAQNFAPRQPGNGQAPPLQLAGFPQNQQNAFAMAMGPAPGPNPVVGPAQGAAPRQPENGQAPPLQPAAAGFPQNQQNALAMEMGQAQARGPGPNLGVGQGVAPRPSVGNGLAPLPAPIPVVGQGPAHGPVTARDFAPRQPGNGQPQAPPLQQAGFPQNQQNPLAMAMGPAPGPGPNPGVGHCSLQGQPAGDSLAPLLAPIPVVDRHPAQGVAPQQPGNGQAPPTQPAAAGFPQNRQSVQAIAMDQRLPGQGPNPLGESPAPGPAHGAAPRQPARNGQGPPPPPAPALDMAQDLQINVRRNPDANPIQAIGQAPAPVAAPGRVQSPPNHVEMFLGPGGLHRVPTPRPQPANAPAPGRPQNLPNYVEMYLGPGGLHRVPTPPPQPANAPSQGRLQNPRNHVDMLLGPEGIPRVLASPPQPANAPTQGRPQNLPNYVEMYLGPGGLHRVPTPPSQPANAPAPERPQNPQNPQMGPNPGQPMSVMEMFMGQRLEAVGLDPFSVGTRFQQNPWSMELNGFGFGLPPVLAAGPGDMANLMMLNHQEMVPRIPIRQPPNMPAAPPAPLPQPPNQAAPPPALAGFAVEQARDIAAIGRAQNAAVPADAPAPAQDPVFFQGGPPGPNPVPAGNARQELNQLQFGPALFDMPDPAPARAQEPTPAQDPAQQRNQRLAELRAQLEAPIPDEVQAEDFEDELYQMGLELEHDPEPVAPAPAPAPNQFQPQNQQIDRIVGQLRDRIGARLEDHFLFRNDEIVELNQNDVAEGQQGDGQ